MESIVAQEAGLQTSLTVSVSLRPSPVRLFTLSFALPSFFPAADCRPAAQ